MEAIYARFSRRETSFENTLSLLQELMNARLNPNFKRIWVQASNSGKTRFCFTIFPVNGQYNMEFLEMGSFRHFRTDGNIDEEIQLIENFINRLSEGLLNGVIV